MATRWTDADLRRVRQQHASASKPEGVQQTRAPRVTPLVAPEMLSFAGGPHGVVVPIRLYSESNMGGRRRDQIARKLLVKKTVAETLMLLGPWRPALPCVVTMIRLAPTTLDEGAGGSLDSTFKSTRDTIATWLRLPPGKGGRPDDSDSRVTWCGGQRKSASWGLEIRFTRRDP